MNQENINLAKRLKTSKAMSKDDKQGKRSILYGYECEIEVCTDICKALNKFDLSGLHSLKREEITDKVKALQSELSELLKKLN